MSENVKIKYLLGIDGGGTKTEFLLTDLNGKEIKRLTLGASNPVNLGLGGAEKVLADGITEISKDVNLCNVSVFAGLAGGISGNNKTEINKFLSSFGFGVFGNGSDTDNALKISLKGKNGVTVIIGTGIVAFAQVNGTKHRIGGWGYLIDKGGSGFNFGSDALDCALHAVDGRGGSQLVLRLIEKKLGNPLPDAIPDIYKGGAPFVASFAPIVFEAFTSGDTEARAIIERNTVQIAQIIRTGYAISKGKVVLCGGLCRHENILRPFLEKELNNEIPLTFSTEPQVNGALALAKSQI